MRAVLAVLGAGPCAGLPGLRFPGSLTRVGRARDGGRAAPRVRAHVRAARCPSRPKFVCVAVCVCAGRPSAGQMRSRSAPTQKIPSTNPAQGRMGSAPGRPSAGRRLAQATPAGSWAHRRRRQRPPRRAAERLLPQNQPRVCDRLSCPQVRSPPQTPPKAAGARAAAPRCLARGRHRDGSGPTARARRATVRRPRPVLMLRKAGPRMPSVIL